MPNPPTADAPNRVWAADFQFDATTDDRPVRIVSIVDYLSTCEAVFTDQRPVGLAQDVDIIAKRSDRSILLYDIELDLRCATTQFDD